SAWFHEVSGDGRHVVSILGRQRLCWHDLAGRHMCVPTAGIDVNAWDRAASPDGRSCFYVRPRSEEHTSELQSRVDLVCRLLLVKVAVTYVFYPLSLHDALPIFRLVS